MSAVEISEAADLELGLDGTGDYAFEARARDFVESYQHGVCGFADGDDENAAVRIQIVKVFTDSEDAALGVQVARESLRDAGFAEGVVEDVAGDLFQRDFYLMVSLIHASIASRISRKRPSKK
jgi:hypothetical protein